MRVIIHHKYEPRCKPDARLNLIFIIIKPGFMKNRILFHAAFILLFLSVTTLTAQPSIEWQKCLGGGGWDVGRSTRQTTDGGYIVAGYSMSIDGEVTGNHGAFDMWVVKLNATGAIQWQKSLGGSDFDYASSIQQTTDGGYIVAGETQSNDGDVSGNHGNSYDFWVVKLDTAGTIQWQKCLGGSGGESASSVRQTSDGGYIVAGFTWLSYDGDVTGNHGDFDAWVVKLDASGNLQWQKCLGGTDREYAYSVRQTNDGGYIVASRTSSNNGDVTGNHGNNDCWIVKLDASGNIQWQKCLGGSEAEYAFSIQLTMDGGFIFTGFTMSNDGDVTGNHSIPGPYNDAWVVKLDSSGNLQWQKCLGGSWDDWGYAIWQTNEGGYLVSCITKSHDQDVTKNHDTTGTYWDYWVVKLDFSGNIQWQRCLGGMDDDETYEIQQTSDGGIIIIGSSYSWDGDVTGNHGGGDYWIVKLSTITDLERAGLASAITLYPNPVKDHLQLKLPQNAEITILDINGQVVTRCISETGEITLDLSWLVPGIYNLKISSGREMMVKKFIKK
jgi:hypothetical protein